jgi:hypothetical protein
MDTFIILLLEWSHRFIRHQLNPRYFSTVDWVSQVLMTYVMIDVMKGLNTKWLSLELVYLYSKLYVLMGYITVANIWKWMYKKYDGEEWMGLVKECLEKLSEGHKIEIYYKDVKVLSW